MRSRLAVLPLTLLIAAGAARADVIHPDSPPVCTNVPECPAGSSPDWGHGCPSVCRPNPRCESDADCDDGAGGCVPTRFCIVQARVDRGMTETVADACDPSGPCGTGAPPEGDGPRCVEVSRCVYPPARREAAPVREGGCAGCLVAPRAAAELAPLALVLLALAQRRRR